MASNSLIEKRHNAPSQNLRLETELEDLRSSNTLNNQPSPKKSQLNSQNSSFEPANADNAKTSIQNIELDTPSLEAQQLRRSQQMNARPSRTKLSINLGSKNSLYHEGEVHGLKNQTALKKDVSKQGTYFQQRQLTEKSLQSYLADLPLKIAKALQKSNAGAPSSLGEQSLVNNNSDDESGYFKLDYFDKYQNFTKYYPHNNIDQVVDQINAVSWAKRANLRGKKRSPVYSLKIFDKIGKGSNINL